MKESVIGFIGFGLIGGSIARSIKRTNPKNTILVYNYTNKEITTKRENQIQSDFDIDPGLELAHSESMIDCIIHHFEDFSTCDIIFLCAPVLANIGYLPILKSIIKSECILTDVGSVKGTIHLAIIEQGLEEQFIGGHPMAGSEKSGYENSSCTLLENAYYILTPTKKTPTTMVDALYHMIEKLGAIPLILEEKEHDDITAAISHVPHIIASSLVNMIKDSDDKEEKMRYLAAGGFKDITRIASSSSIMWQNICLTNTESIQAYLRKYINSLESFYQSLERKKTDDIYGFFEKASEYRNSIPNKSNGIIEKVFEIYLDIIDEAGAIATIATTLATNRISIKNIGIIHNREFAEGVLRIEFYENDATQNAIDLLKRYNYTIYER